MGNDVPEYGLDARLTGARFLPGSDEVTEVDAADVGDGQHHRSVGRRIDLWVPANPPSGLPQG